MDMRRTDYLKASPPMFESRLLDRFTRVHPAVPLLIYVPLIVVMLVLGVGRDGWWDTLGLAVFGYVLWTLFEYWLHRLVFHFEPKDGIGARLHWMIHGVHHDHPNDPLRLVMPPAASIPLALAVIAVLWLVLGPIHAPAVVAGFFIGYVIYDEMHYALHHHTPKSRLGKRLRELHMRHHFQDDERGFGISAPYWDIVFRTVPRSRDEVS
jgi:sterol desaturase/sphingolipid hydroxylase (fatty acid hydroxylase superfamily)